MKPGIEHLPSHTSFCWDKLSFQNEISFGCILRTNILLSMFTQDKYMKSEGDRNLTKKNLN